MSFTPIQERLIQAILLSPGDARTDKLGERVGLSPSQVAAHLLPLRESKLIATTNDGGAYQLWSLTIGMQKELDKRRRDTVSAIPQGSVSPVAKPFIVYSVSNAAGMPSPTEYASREAAEQAAIQLSQNHKKKVFFVAELLSRHVVKTQTVQAEVAENIKFK